MNFLSNLGITAPQGFLASGIHCGLKKNNLNLDLALVYSTVPASAAGVYTKNKVKGAPIYITKEHLSNKKALLSGHNKTLSFAPHYMKQT